MRNSLKHIIIIARGEIPSTEVKLQRAGDALVLVGPRGNTPEIHLRGAA